MGSAGPSATCGSTRATLAGPGRQPGIGEARADLVGLIIDGARMVSPGLLATALLASRLADRPVITAPAWHLGPTTHMRAAEADTRPARRTTSAPAMRLGQQRLRAVRPGDVGRPSWRCWFGATSESSSLFLRAETWRALDGLDERFDLPGGGLVNHDLYERACGLPGSRLVVMLGEGTFHQIHGGAATSRRFTGRHARRLPGAAGPPVEGPGAGSALRWPCSTGGPSQRGPLGADGAGTCRAISAGIA